MSLWGVVHEYLAGVLPLAPEINEAVIRSGDLCPETYPDSTHHCHMFTAAELQSFLEDAGAEVVALSASNCLSAVWGDRLDEARSDPVQWRQLLDMEVQACRQPGCLDMGTHLIAVARRP
jgi:hypothetical protein